MVADRDGMEQVFVPGGEFLMGSEGSDPSAGEDEQPQRTVFLDDFWIDRTEVTNGMYARCLQDGACQPPGDVASNMRAAYFDDPSYEDYPVIFVSWEDASAYCAWAGRRLPSEAEWEKAARGLNGQIYPWGDISPTSQLANFANYVGDTSIAGHYPAGTSPFGALDMAGNVSEWVADWYSQDYYDVAPLDNPLGPDSGEFRVLRGGSWFTSARALRGAFRLGNYPELRSESIGFRCALSG
jgi:formylglycine-generating enzyme required for sulfatase activity